MQKQPEVIRNRLYSFFPSNLSVVKIDGNYVLLGPILYELLKERGISQHQITRQTGFDFRTLRDFLHGKQTKRLTIGIGVASQVLRMGNITIPEIVERARAMRALGTLPCVKPLDVAQSDHDGRMEERNPQL